MIGGAGCSLRPAPQEANVKGRSEFDRQTAEQVRRLLSQVRNARPENQKVIRDDIRALGFYISDWDRSSRGFTPDDFDELVRLGRVKVIDD